MYNTHFTEYKNKDAWNRLPDDVVGACSVSAFKDRLDKWMTRHGHQKHLMLVSLVAMTVTVTENNRFAPGNYDTDRSKPVRKIQPKVYHITS